MKIDINIYKGKVNLEYADVNIIIDVIRAFTVSYQAFLNNAESIILVSNEKKAYVLKNKIDNSLLSGEINGYKINGFDFGNSPYEISKFDLNNKILIQKTTNGVNVTLNSLNAKNIYVTGYVNSMTLASHIKNLIKSSNKNSFKINIVASHPTGEEDIACANYIKTIILKENIDLKKMDEDIIYKIKNSKAAEKFLDINNKDFSINDLILTMLPQNSNFIMEIEKGSIIKINKRIVKCMD